MQIIVRRDLEDYDSWKKAVFSRTEVRKEMGSKGATIYRSAKKPNQVYLVFEWDDQKSYLDYVNLSDTRKALAETGTTEIIEISESFYLEA